MESPHTIDDAATLVLARKLAKQFTGRVLHAFCTPLLRTIRVRRALHAVGLALIDVASAPETAPFDFEGTLARDDIQHRTWDADRPTLDLLDARIAAHYQRLSTPAS